MSDGIGLGSETLDALLDRTRRALETASGLGGAGLGGAGLDRAGLDRAGLDRAGRGGAGAGQPEQDDAQTSLSGVGQGADGLIQATVAPNRLTELRISPEAGRLSMVDLADGITAAINAGFEELHRQAGTADALREARSLATGLSAELKDLQNDSMRSMAAIGQVLEDILAQLREDR